MPTIDLLSIQQILEDFTCLKITNKQLRKYFTDLLSTAWKTLRKGHFFDSEWLFKQLHHLMQKQRANISNRVMVEILLMECQFWIKRKRPERLQKSREQLVTYIEQLRQEEMDDIIERYNLLILFDPKIQLIDSMSNDLVLIIRLSDEGKIETAIDQLKVILNKPVELKQIKLILMGKIYLLQPSVEALEYFSKVAKCQFLYENHLAKLLFVAGYKALQKLSISPSQYREEYYQYQLQLKDSKSEFENNNTQKLELIIKKIKHSTIFSEQLNHIEEALSLMAQSPCYPSPSILQLDLYLITISVKINEGKLTDAKRFVQKSKQTADRIGIYSGSRQSKINYKLALIYEREKKIEQALVLVNKCILQQFKYHELEILTQMKDRLEGKRVSLDNSMIYEEEEQVESVVEKVKNKKPAPVVNTLRTQENQDSQQQRQNPIPKPQLSKANCCILF